MSGLPSGYKQLEYIESTGTQYIKTNVKAPSSGLRIQIKFRYTGDYGNASVFGSETSGISGSGEYSIVPYGSPSSFYVGGSRSVAQKTTAQGVDYTLDATAANGTLTTVWNGVASTVVYTQYLNTTYPIALFGNNISGTVSQKCPMRLYSCKIYDNGTLARDFVPCKNASGAVGLYDTVDGQFYANAGTGTFTAGPEIIPDPPAAPTGLQTVLAVVLQWAASESADRYDVYRDGAKLGSTATTQYVDATPEANQTYGYTVKAVNAGGESAGTSITVYTKSGYFEYKPLIESANFP